MAYVLRGTCKVLVGDRVTVLKGKYAHHEGVVTSFSINHNPIVCVVHMGNGKDIAVREDELEVKGESYAY